MDQPHLRILEIGDYDYFKLTLPSQTTLLWTGYRPPLNVPTDFYECTPAHFRRCMHDVQQNRYDVIVTYARGRPPWRPFYLAQSFRHTPLRPLAAFMRVFGVSMLRLAKFNTPLIVLDMQDAPTIHACDFFLMDKAKAFLKRELPVDHWQVLYGSAHPALPTSRIRKSRTWRKRIAKLAPISLPVWPIDVGPAEDVFANKSTDVFFAGAIDNNSTVRTAGANELRAMAQDGFRIDMPSQRLSGDEYQRRMSQAWLTWSPAGLGWDCYRHYEAPQCLSVPVINSPTIQRHEPLQDGVHAFYYPPEPGGLQRTIAAALQDKDRLRQMAMDGRAHVQRHHVAAAICAHVLKTALA